MREKAGNAWREQGLVFTSRMGNHISRVRIWATFTKLLAAAGLLDMHFHGLRHSTATILLSMGVSPNVVQKLLGQSDNRITPGIYGHVLPGMQQEAMEKMDGLFGSNEQQRTGPSDKS